MSKLIKNGDIIFDGVLNREQLEKQAFEKLEKLERIIELCDLIDDKKDIKIHNKKYYPCYALYDFYMEEIVIMQTFECEYDDVDKEVARVKVEDYEKTWWLV